MAIGSDVVTVSTTKVLAAAGNYAADDVLSENASSGTSWNFPNCSSRKGGSGIVHTITVTAQGAADLFTPRIRFYNATPACTLNDNAANNGPIFGDIDIYLGEVLLPIMAINTGGIATITGSGSSAAASGLPFYFTCAGDDTDLYAVVTTDTAETGETASDDLKVRLVVERF